MGPPDDQRASGTRVERIKRVMKKLNDYIINNYEKVLFPEAM
jgi:hypothetical protein